MPKEKTNINLALSKELLEKIKQAADKNELTTTAMIRLILQAYFNDNKDEKIL